MNLSLLLPVWYPTWKAKINCHELPSLKQLHDSYVIVQGETKMFKPVYNSTQEYIILFYFAKRSLPRIIYVLVQNLEILVITKDEELK
jgi:hypothetical protein